MITLQTLVAAPGVSGREGEVCSLIRAELAKVVDSVSTDALGNVIAVRKAHRSAGRQGPEFRLGLFAHMDEVGFLVRHIDDRGFIWFETVGRFDPLTLMFQRVVVHGRRALPGILTSARKPVHLLDPDDVRIPKLAEFFVDVGLPGDEVRALARPGDAITLEGDLLELGNCVTARSLDNRVGLYVMLRAIAESTSHEVDLYAVATVQEERGLRGAVVAGEAINPHMAVVLDVTTSADWPGSRPHERLTELGKGVAIKIMDGASISDRRLVDFLREVAEQENIPHQFELRPGGGTDAGAVQVSGHGVPVVSLTVPVRHVHSAVEIAHKDDLDSAARLLARFIERAHEVPEIHWA